MIEPKSVRYFRFKDDEIFKLLTEKDSLITELKQMQAKIDEIAEEGKSKANKIQKIKDKSIPMMQVYADKVDLSDWEIITQFQIEGDEIAVQIVDQVEAEKERILHAKKEAEEAKRVKNENTSSDTVSDTDTPQNGGEDTPTV